ncbi:DUF1311 domain-containing protein [Bradyrhizobium elkanii]|uniref:DUF1311 domain-containing protein n=1 Tax=Bradyrhizobium elkanii TaxID=29448 RepID=UPI001BA91A51|nr:DUF1311 domain-containing protein [Bradyrhizobium elkanii]MBR1157916.1 DUF1311 domain-containing protein [Bradyrhizobium elkanii]
MHMKYPARTGKASRSAAGGDGMHRGGTHVADDKQREQLRTAQRLWIMRSMTEARARELENLGHQ